MNQENALAIRTLTEAMTNAYNMNDEGLQRALRDRIFSLIAPQAPETPFVVEGDQVYLNEKVVAEPAKAIEDLVQESIGDNCPCCVISGLLVSGEPFPFGVEEFLYGFAKGAGAELTRSTIQAVATEIQERSKEDRSLLTKEFAHRYAEFTLATTRVRERLAEEGLLPPLNPLQQLQKELLEIDLKQRLAEL